MSTGFDFESQRLANIERNKKLLQSLQLNAISHQIKDEITKNNELQAKTKSEERSRKSRRIKDQGSDSEANTGSESDSESDEEHDRSHKHKHKKLKTQENPRSSRANSTPIVQRRSRRVAGEDASLQGFELKGNLAVRSEWLPDKPREKSKTPDLRVGKRTSRNSTGNRHKSPTEEPEIDESYGPDPEKVKERLLAVLDYQMSDTLKFRDLVKVKAAPDSKEDQPQVPTPEMISETLLTSPMSFSCGDYYDLLREKQESLGIDSYLKETREKFSKLDLNVLNLDMTPDTATHCAFHTYNSKISVLASDVQGNFALFDTKEEDEEGSDDDDEGVINYALHDDAITSFDFSLADPTKIYTASKDFTIGMFDLKDESIEDFYTETNNESILDLKVKGNNIFYCTSEGHLQMLDIRAPHSGNNVSHLSSLDVHSLSVHKDVDFLVSTVSKDALLRVWDLRFTKKGWGTKVPIANPAGCVLEYDSRQRLTSIDWSSNYNLVAATLRQDIVIFDTNKTYANLNPGIPTKIQPDTSRKHLGKTLSNVYTSRPTWQSRPMDGVHKFVVGNARRYFDIYDSKGNILAHLGEPEDMLDVPTTCALHPELNWVAGVGHRGKLYLYK
ncbi:hypothetical protein WICPIJ_004926 [Wickerhamomyces pijperi]|uniref:DNA damage-binding protein CMR1 n=1 Tax=Wickerhamomyces pijperi TaxID=599730 RepID=A0A9P8Q6Q9_WICPI|nr:hypothetical protein WICPIJ_004926 [Wickerhamomyces pijperi]